MDGLGEGVGVVSLMACSSCREVTPGFKVGELFLSLPPPPPLLPSPPVQNRAPLKGPLGLLMKTLIMSWGGEGEGGGRWRGEGGGWWRGEGGGQSGTPAK